MNSYVIRVNNATINTEGVSEYAAIKNLCIFGEPHMIEAITVTDWIYQVEVNRQITLAYIKRVN